MYSVCVCVYMREHIRVLVMCACVHISGDVGRVGCSHHMKNVQLSDVHTTSM